MKKMKKIALLSLGALSILGAAVTAVAVACNNPSSSKDPKVQSSLILGSEIALEKANSNTPTKGEDYLVNLSDENSEFMNFFIDPYKSFELFAKNLDKAGYSISEHEPLKDLGFSNFEAYAKDAISKVKAYVKAIANLPTIKKLREANTTVLFAESSQSFNTSNASLLDKYFYQQADLLPVLYSTPDHEVPGFGLKFPKPNDHESDKYFDNWHGIGASQNNASSKSQNDTWRAGLYKSYFKTADFMFYNYDSNKLATGVTKEAFEKFFKEKTQNEKVLLSDFQMEYSGIWGLVGQAAIAESFAKKLGVSDVELKTVELLKWTPPKKQVHIRPSGVSGEKVKLAVNFYSVWDHLIALGIAPDYSIKNDEKGSTYQDVAGVFAKYYNKSLTEFKNFRGDAAAMASMQLYALASNTSHVARHGYTQYIGENKEILKTVETERGDSDNTRSGTEFKFYNRKENKLETAKPKEQNKKFSSYKQPATNSGSH